MNEATAFIIVAVITTIGNAINIILQRQTKREVTSGNGSTTGQTVTDLAHGCAILSSAIRQIQADLRENSKDTNAIARAFNRHLDDHNRK